MDEKNFKQILSEQTKEFKEDYRSFGNGLKKELKEDYQRQGGFLVEEFEKRTEFIAESFTDLRKGHERLEKKLDAVMEMTAQNTENIEYMKQLLKRKIDVEEFEMLEHRVLLIEKKIRV
jgi:hypothetical protein